MRMFQPRIAVGLGYYKYAGFRMLTLSELQTSMIAQAVLDVHRVNCGLPVLHKPFMPCENELCVAEGTLLPKGFFLTELGHNGLGFAFQRYIVANHFLDNKPEVSWLETPPRATAFKSFSADPGSIAQGCPTLFASEAFMQEVMEILMPEMAEKKAQDKPSLVQQQAAFEMV
jgi:hypothetical protein